MRPFPKQLCCESFKGRKYSLVEMFSGTCQGETTVAHIGDRDAIGLVLEELQIEPLFLPIEVFAFDHGEEVGVSSEKTHQIALQVGEDFLETGP